MTWATPIMEQVDPAAVEVFPAATLTVASAPAVPIL